MDVDSDEDARQAARSRTISPASSPSTTRSSPSPPPEAKGQQPSKRTEPPLPAAGTAMADGPAVASYADQLDHRRALFRPQAAATGPPPRNYAIESIFTIPHSTHMHALAAPPCLSHLYTGGADGYIRRYGLHATLNGTGVDNPLYNNLSMKVGGHAPSPSVDVRQPVLVGYWENEEPGEWVQELLSSGTAGGGGEAEREARAKKVKWGPKGGPLGAANGGKGQSQVYSLAVQSEELWGLSGTSHGTINLFTIRHDEGQIRHVFRSSDASANQGHHSKSPVSVLTLADKETSFISGGWDSRILQWDMNTGLATRAYEGHISQISSIAFRPLPTSTGAEGPSPAASDASSATGVAASLVKPPGTSTIAGDGGSEVDADADADGEVDDEAMPLAAAQGAVPTLTGANGKAGVGKGGSHLPMKPASANEAPVMGGEQALPELSKDVFLSTSVDGVVMLWDRRVKSAGALGGVRRLASSGKDGGWATSAAWSTNGQEIYVGRRTSCIEIYDLRSTSPSSPVAHTLRLPSSTGAVSAVKAMPNGRHLLAASNDNVRLWDLEAAHAASEAGAKQGKVPPYTIVPGHHGGVTSAIYVDTRTHYMISTSGNRGWEGTSTENLVVHSIKAVE